MGRSHGGHAHISYESDARGFRLHDDGSEQRNGDRAGGQNCPVRPGRVACGLASADEIVLGEARLRVNSDCVPAPGSDPGR